MYFNQIVKSFQEAIASHGIKPPQHIEADGKLHRFYIQGDKPGHKNGWYTLFIDNIPCGVYGSWKSCETHKWCSKKLEYMSGLERSEFHRQMVASKLQHEKALARDQAEAAQKAERIYNDCHMPDPIHPYLVRKRIKPFWARQRGDCLALPVIDFDGAFWSIQFINLDGMKRFLSHGAIAGHFIPIQHQPPQSQHIIICEGFATGATLAEAYPKSCVVAACNAGNLKPVAMQIRTKLPNAELIICSDDDRLNPDNPGLTKGREAAIAAGALLSKPTWPEGAPTSLTDFNDLACWLKTLETVK